LSRTGRLSDKQVGIITNMLYRYRKQISYARERANRKDDIIEANDAIKRNDASEMPTEKDVTSFRKENHAFITPEQENAINQFMFKYGKSKNSIRR